MFICMALSDYEAVANILYWIIMQLYTYDRNSFGC